jgi:hypothetical protein
VALCFAKPGLRVLPGVSRKFRYFHPFLRARRLTG